MMEIAIGYLIVGIAADNFGRRRPLIVLQTIGLIGYLMVLFAPNITFVAIGMFLTGFGSQTCYGLSFSILKEILSNKRRQKMEILCQSLTVIAALGVVGMFYLFKDWKIIFKYYAIAPLLICYILTIIFFK